MMADCLSRPQRVSPESLKDPLQILKAKDEGEVKCVEL